MHCFPLQIKSKHFSILVESNLFQHQTDVALSAHILSVCEMTQTTVENIEKAVLLNQIRQAKLYFHNGKMSFA